MRIGLAMKVTSRGGKGGFSIVEAILGLVLLGLVCMALFSGLTTSTFSVQMARDNLRATQIMSEKLDTIRLYSWKQLTNTPSIQGFNLPLYAPDPLSPSQTNSAVFQGTVRIASAPVTEFYGKDMRLVTVELTWKTGKLQRTRSMSTLVSRYGTYQYIY